MPPLKNPWSKYSTTVHDAITLDEVMHVAHIDTSLRILKDRKLKAGLVFDESRLNTQRILVNWVSPNRWNPGYRYGSVGFLFDFKSLVKRKYIYWVEAMTQYRPTACRFLLSANKYPDLKLYDPRIDNGPLLSDRAKREFKRKDDICMEIMVESDLPLANCKSIKFLKHHPSMCCINQDSCTEIGIDVNATSEKMIAYILSNNIELDTSLFTKRDNKGRVRSGVFFAGVYEILRLASKVSYSGEYNMSEEVARLIVNAGMVYLSSDQRDEFRKLINIFSGSEVFQKYFLAIVKDKLNLHSINEFDI